MVRLEFKKFEKDEFREVIKALLNGSEYKFTYKDKEGNDKSYSLVKNGRLYIGNNYTIAISENKTTGETYLSVDYLSADDRVQLYKQKQEQELSELEL